MNNSTPTLIYTLSLHDALPISTVFNFKGGQLGGGGGTLSSGGGSFDTAAEKQLVAPYTLELKDRKNTRLNSSDVHALYAASCMARNFVINNKGSFTTAVVKFTV